MYGAAEEGGESDCHPDRVEDGDGVGKGRRVPQYLSSSLHDGTINLDSLPPRAHPGELSPESRCLKQTAVITLPDSS